MSIEDFINKTVILELKDSSTVKGILLSIDKKYDPEEEDNVCELVLRVNHDDYRLIDVNEIITIGEIN